MRTREKSLLSLSWKNKVALRSLDLRRPSSTLAPLHQRVCERTQESNDGGIIVTYKAFVSTHEKGTGLFLCFNLIRPQTPQSNYPLLGPSETANARPLLSRVPADCYGSHCQDECRLDLSMIIRASCFIGHAHAGNENEEPGAPRRALMFLSQWVWGN